MWWEIIPTAGIIYGFLLAPNAVNWAINKLSRNGKSCGRNFRGTFPNWPDYAVFLRDGRITGSEYIPRGLESIPDLKED